MKKHTEKPPIDELFARKLGNASLTPTSDSFARLQARMGHHKLEPKMVFWRNPAMQRYLAAAACLLLVCSVGWRYWPSTRTTEQQGDQLATNQPVKPELEKPVRKEATQPQREQTPGVTSEGKLVPEATTNQVAVADDLNETGKNNNNKISHGVGPKISVQSNQSTPVAPMLAQEKPVENKPKVDVALPAVVTATTPVATEQVADAKPIVKSSPIAERVLVVTIAEPEALVAARQAAKVSVEEKVALAQDEKSVKETKAGGLWQQVKRIKEGEVFARQDNTNSDESGLLGRAYSGLKHSLEKDKTTKQ